MIARVKIGRNERLLLECGVNQFKVVGPGLVWLTPRQRSLTLLDVGSQGQAFVFDEVQTVEKVPVEITVQVIYRVNPDLFTDDLLPAIPMLNEGGWLNVLRWQTEHVLRQLLADYPWRDLGRQSIQQRLERQFTATLAGRLKGIALNVDNVSLVKLILPIGLQKTLVRAVQDGVEAQGRAMVLKEYFDIFGSNLPRAMPYIVQWELLNKLHKDGNLQLLSTTNFALEPLASDVESSPRYQMTLPLLKANKEVGVGH